MSTLNPRKVIALVTAVSLAFLQVVPVGYAGNEPVDQALGTSVPATVPADNTKTAEAQL